MNIIPYTSSNITSNNNNTTTTTNNTTNYVNNANDNRRNSYNTSTPSFNAPRRQRTSVVDSVFQKLTDFGDSQLALSGAYENLALLQYLDVDLKKTWQVSDWFSVADLFTGLAHRSLDFSLDSKFAAVAAAFVRLKVAEGRRFSKGEIKWPKAQALVVRRNHAVRQLLRSWRSGSKMAMMVGEGGGEGGGKTGGKTGGRGEGWRMKSKVVESHSTDRLLMDLIPGISFVLSLCAVRPLAPQLMSQVEKTLVDEAVGIMTSSNNRMSNNSNNVNYSTPKWNQSYSSSSSSPYSLESVDGLPQLNLADLDPTSGVKGFGAGSNLMALRAVLGVVKVTRE
eukprot:CAMPEP_0175070522 /NCGR_PEP_ID=MMETSP0052_2-20121109/18760_1 /TAXON_ID=51329 ORGANISM="Polytomella parva, Strain SAG 63-3" /NCGR_SAMPLE_ID=MMETSP0052_2 /ASSEMBLY_ACC=CAM_ASM_000194 /LENGTH=336 /DNA_ID=CAMNT_0016337643 /DNA_START=443 /DNA_END=1451 /DNA_ORIENTATION=+